MNGKRTRSDYDTFVVICDTDTKLVFNCGQPNHGGDLCFFSPSVYISKTNKILKIKKKCIVFFRF